MAENFFDRERAALARLTDAVRARVAAEAELTTALQLAAEKAERELARARRSNALARQSELGRIDETHAEAAAAVSRKYDAEQFTADRAWDDRRTQTSERFKTAEQRGRTEYKDRLWHIDSMLEAGEKAAKEQLEALQRKAVGGTEEVAALWAAAGPVLARGRVRRSDVEYHGELPPPSDDDPITRMNKAVAASGAALEKLRRLWSPKLSRPVGLFVCVLVAGALGAAVGFPLLDLPAALGLTAGMGLVLGVALWVCARWLGHWATRAQGKVLGQYLAQAARACRLLNDFAAWEYAQERIRISERHVRKRKEADEYYLPLFEQQKKTYETELERLDAEHEAQTKKLRRQRKAETKAEVANYCSLREKEEARLDAEAK